MQTRPGGTRDPSDRAGPSRSGLGSRRVVWSAFGTSILLHVLAVLLYPTLFESLDPDVPAFFPSDRDPPDGLEVIQLIDIEPFEPEEPAEPEEIEEVSDPEAEVGGPVLDALPGIEVVPLGPSAAERLRPDLQEARLWRRPPAAFYELSLEQREELLIAGRLTAWLDSVAVAEAAENALTDWTVTDSDGGRWGISPGQLHLGDVTVPLPINFGVPVGKRDETNMLVWQWEEIMRQGRRADVEATWRERAEAIRARRDAERAAQPPDTTRWR